MGFLLLSSCSVEEMLEQCCCITLSFFWLVDYRVRCSTIVLSTQPGYHQDIKGCAGVNGNLESLVLLHLLHPMFFLVYMLPWANLHEHMSFRSQIYLVAA